jgi:hypothetical protein
LRAAPNSKQDDLAQIGSCVLKLTEHLTKMLVTVIVRCGKPTLSLQD